jgi:hypothetical protein
MSGLTLCWHYLQVPSFGTGTPCWVFPLNLGPNYPKVRTPAHSSCTNIELDRSLRTQLLPGSHHCHV